MKNAKNEVKIINMAILFFSYYIFYFILTINSYNTSKYKIIHEHKLCLYVKIKMLMVAKLEVRRNFLATQNQT